MEGVWVVPSRGNYQIPFIAKHGEGHRFSTVKKKPAMDISGKWQVTFLDDKPYYGIGEFKQVENKLTGTFMTETGDYRFLEGEVQDNKVYLSVFDGAHAFLYEAKINANDSTMIGSFRSGKHYKTVWEAKKNENAKLKNPNDLTFLKEGYDKIEFSFPNSDGKMISLEDEKYQGKAKIIQIFGTWCPNCRDETNFLKEYLSNNKHTDLEIIGLAFEKHRELDKAKASVKRYKDKLNLPYEMLIAGYSNKKEAAKSLPMLNHILSYPTMIFIDKNDKVTKIHTGFNGPATSEFENYKKEFEENVQEILGAD